MRVLTCGFFIALTLLTGCTGVINQLAKEPAPPLVQPIHEMKKLDVLVINPLSATRLEPAQAEIGIAKTIQPFARDFKIQPQSEKNEPDGILTITVKKEVATRIRSDSIRDSATWKFDEVFAVSLRGSDGKELWKRSSNSISYEVTWDEISRHGVNPLADEEVRKALEQRVGTMLAAELARLR